MALVWDIPPIFHPGMNVHAVIALPDGRLLPSQATVGVINAINALNQQIGKPWRIGIIYAGEVPLSSLAAGPGAQAHRTAPRFLVYAISEVSPPGLAPPQDEAAFDLERGNLAIVPPPGAPSEDGNGQPEGAS